MKKEPNIKTLFTSAAENIPECPHSEYPRPQLRRQSYLNLNGYWDFCATKGEMPQNFSEEILVPFPPQSALSGIMKDFQNDDVLFYRRRFTLPDGFKKDRVILHIGAADQKTEVYLNGVSIGTHVGGYLPFSFDITEKLCDENELVLKISDDKESTVLPYGKQRAKRGGMWYTPISGVWQTVWLESVPKEYIKSIKIDTDITGATIRVDGVQSGEVVVSLDGGEKSFPLSDGVCTVSPENPELWSPENPKLYYFTVVAGEDRVQSYFALRSLEIKNVKGIPRLCLNGKPYFFNALLDQGYFSDGIYTPASLSCFKDDIVFAKSAGFNTLRKHIKIEPEQFYYDCDRLGMVVFQDMVNNGDYSFLRDTALPTVGKKRRNDKNLHRDKATREAFLEAMDKTVSLLYNHPSICLWTIFNEGWGQFESTACYRRLRGLDKSRFVDTASGWFSGGESDVDSQHVYFKPYRFKAASKPVILSEFGGYAWQVKDHVFNPDNQYGYRSFKTGEEFSAAIKTLYCEQIIPAVKQGLCAAVYTQLTDVEDETNGLLTYDRRVPKIDAEALSRVMKNLHNEL